MENNFLTKEQVKKILDNAPDNIDKTQIIKGLVDRGYTLEGLTPIQVKKTEQPTLGGKIVRDLATPFARLATNIVQAGQTFAGKELTQPFSGEYLGEVNPVGQKGTFAERVRESLGIGARVGSTVVGGSAPVKVAGMGLRGLVKQAIIRGVKESGVAGGAFGLGKSLEEGYPALETLTNTITSAILGAIGGGVFGGVTGGLTPAVSGIGRTIKKSTKLAGRVGSELEGALTGTSGETIRQAFDAARRGGVELDEFTEALRGRTTPEELIGTLKDATTQVSARKSENFSRMIKELGNERVNTSGVLKSINQKLSKFKIRVTDEGLDFSKSKFRTVPQAQDKINAMYDEILRLGDTQTLSGVDTSRQALSNLLLTGDDSSARAANSIITEAIDSVRSSGTKTPKIGKAYEKALKDFGEDAQFLSEIEKSLASGDNRTIDTTYRRIITTLKTNNEQRMKLLQELDKETGGFLLSKIAGQQLSEELPRGIIRAFAASLAGAGVATGFSGVGVGILPMLLTASPRVVGEFVRVLGIGVRKADILLKSIMKVRKYLGVTSVYSSPKEYTNSPQNIPMNKASISKTLLPTKKKSS